MDFKKYVDTYKEQLVKVRRHLHMNPELSLHEYETSKFIRSYLDKVGIKYSTVEERSIVAVIKGRGPGKTLGIRSDIDALPINEMSGVEYNSNNSGVMHACGHDTHTSMALAAACVLNELKGEFDGEVRVLFQEAEEVGAGAMNVMKSGLLDGVDNFIGLHVDLGSDIGKFVTSRGYRSAKGARITINIEGKPGHSSEPRLAVNPILVSAQVIQAVSSMINNDPHIGKDIICTPTIFNSGETQNIIPGKAQIVYDSRYYENRFDEYLQKRFEEVAGNAARAAGAIARVTVEPSGEPMVNHPEIVDLGVKVLQGLYGEDSIEVGPPGLFGDDFAYILKDIDGAMFSIGTAQGGNYYNAHSPTMVINDDFMVYGLEFLLAFSFEYLGS